MEVSEDGKDFQRWYWVKAHEKGKLGEVGKDAQRRWSAAEWRAGAMPC